MNRLLIIILSFVATISLQAAAPTASSILTKTSDKLKTERTLTADFKITSPGSETTTGKIMIDRDHFRYDAGSTVIAFNGTTQWTVDRETKEINIYNPEAEEIAQINPFSILQDYSARYSAKLLRSESAAYYSIELTPKETDQSIRRSVVTISSATYLPSKIVMTLSDGTVATINISNLKTKVNLPKSSFTVKAGDYPGFELIDMR